VDGVLIDGIGGGLAKDESADGYHDDTVDHHPMPAMEREDQRSVNSHEEIQVVRTGSESSLT
jgi:hypothetical protein